PLTFISRLAALVPPPKFHQLTYHGVLAPGDLWRDEVVPVIRARVVRILGRTLLHPVPSVINRARLSSPDYS
ncbi:MAG: hypothetical protein ACI8X5_004168, partial [Planctomycetota bacterium]